MMTRFLRSVSVVSVIGIGFTIGSQDALTQEEANRKSEKPTSKTITKLLHKPSFPRNKQPGRRVELQVILWRVEPPYPRAKVSPEKTAIVGNSILPLTDYFVYLPGLGNIDVVFANDKLKKRAAKWDGREVKITGFAQRIVVIPKKYGDPKAGITVSAGKGKSLWIPNFGDVPKRRAIFWATNLEPIHKNPNPWYGEPSVKSWFGEGDKFYAIKRLPKSRSVTSVKISTWTNRTDHPLTIANIGKVLDGMKPSTKPRAYRYASFASWHGCELETEYGKFYISFYLGGLAVVRFPNGARGFATFVHPTK